MTMSSFLGPLHDCPLDGLVFVRRAFDLFEQIDAIGDGGVTLRERKGDIKTLLEEVLPIAQYVLAHYRLGRNLTVRWMQGSQPFDAEIQAQGRLVSEGLWPQRFLLEVTTAVHPSEHLMRELLNTKGGAFSLDGLTRIKGPNGERSIESECTIHSNQSYVDTMVDLILAAISRKAAKGYQPGTRLVVFVDLNTVYLPDDWQKLVRDVTSACPQHGFAEIFLCAERDAFVASLYPPQQTTSWPR